MDFALKYEEMRPYNDNEVPGVIERIIKEDRFLDVLSFLYNSKEEGVRTIEKVKTTSEFQSAFSHIAVRKIVELTSENLTFSGLEELDNSKPYLFIANHRDIVLDSAIMQLMLIENGHKTSQITFGSNLMSDKFIVDLGKLNKMFTIYRGGSKIQMYRNALLHSGYIRHVLTEKRESAWIAQRNGRTKDGDDKTQVGMVKMLTIGRKDLYPALMELNIVPVTISYEYEPCDAQKVQEVYISRSKPYKKKQDEDMDSILRGIKGYKGKIHITFGTPLNNIFNESSFADMPYEEIINEIVHEIDCQIYKGFALCPGNYIAYDIYMQSGKYFKNKYDQEQKEAFVDYVNKKISTLQGDKEELTKLFLGIYAIPVINKNKVEDK